MGVLLYLVLITVAVLYIRWLIVQKDVAKDIPGPPGLPILGNLITCIYHWDRLQDWIYDMYKIHGTTMKYWFFGGPGKAYILVVEPACVEYVLKTNFNNYVKGEVFHNLMEPLLGNGIFAVDGHMWKKQRQVASHHFSTNSLKAMVGTFVHHGHMVLDLLSKLFPVLNPGLFQNQRIIRKYVNDLIEERRRQPADGLKDKTDLLSRYMSLVDEETGEPYSDEYLRDIILNFIMAGRDTTAEMMSWTFHMLSTHPEEQEILFNEIQANFPNGEDADFDTINKLTYLKAVLNETLRLYPSVPIDTKEALEDDTLPNGYKVPKGAWIVYSPWVSGRAKEYWDSPEEWTPSRWIETPNKPWVFVPFQGGPRTCLGQQMAYIEAKIMISMIIGRYKVTAVPGHKVTYKRSLTLPTSGVKVYFEPRSKF